MNRIYDKFPVFLVKNFHSAENNKGELIEIILKNKQLFYDARGHNFPIRVGYEGFFDDLYKKFYNLCESNFKFTKSKNSTNTCFSYLSDKNNFVEVWHNHLNTSTISGVYYLNVPENDYVTIDFELDGDIFTRKVNNYDLIIFPNYLNHKPNRCYKDGYRISINMEIICNESSDYVFNNIR